MYIYKYFTMNDKQIHIIENNKISAPFVQANHSLALNNKDALNNFTVLRSLWLQTYKAKIDLSKNIIEFNSERDKTIFLLQWS